MTDIIRPLSMTGPQWAALEQLADALNAREPHGRGHNVRVTKWQLIIRGICDGRYIVTEREPYRLPPGLAEAAAEVEERQREQEQRERQRQRIVQHTAQKQAERKTPVKMEQLSILDLMPA
jgi:hypothetical protein